MGILNLSPDSFFDGGKFMQPQKMVRRAGQMLREGAAIIDVGAVSSRPGVRPVSEKTETARLIPAIRKLVKGFPGAVFSVDTTRASVAAAALEEGAAIVNDITGGLGDPKMVRTAVRYQAPFVLMHMKGMPATMQNNPKYKNVVREVLAFLQKRLAALRHAGVHDVIADPGFGFGKTVEHNYELLRNLSLFRMLDCPVLAGLSRKSMIHRVLGTMPAGALNGTTVLNTLALVQGASLLRVHDVKEAVETVKLFEACQL